MEIKLNIPLIDRITGMLSKPEEKPKKREETSETSRNVALYYYQMVKLERTRRARYADYRIMDEEYVECSAALDTFADSAAKDRDEEGGPIEITSEDPKTQNILDELVDRTKIQETIWDTARNVAKMGDDFDEMVVSDDKLVRRLKNLEPEWMSYERDEYGRELERPYIQKNADTETKLADFHPWQIIHWKNGGMKRIYGDSILRPIRRVYKQLQMMEDGLVIGRLTRSHMRLKFLIDVEGMTPEDAEDHIRTVKESVKKRRLINPYTGQLETAQNPLSSEEDLFLGVTKDSKADIDVLQGATNLGNIRDVQHFQDKFFIGLKVPKIFYGLDEGNKAIVIEQVIQFACAVARIRKGLRAGLTKLFSRQLILAGVMPRKDLYQIHFAPVSMVDEMRKWTMEKLKAEVAKIYKIDIGLLDDEYILKNFLEVPDDEIVALLKRGEGPTGRASSKGNGNLALRASGSTGITAPGVTAMAAKKAAQETGGNGFHIAGLQMMNLVETLRDLVSLQLDE